MGGETFRTRPDRPSLLYNGYRVSFPVVKRPGRGINHPAPSNAEVKERVELCFYSPSGSSWPILGGTLLLCYVILLLPEDARIRLEKLESNLQIVATAIVLDIIQ